MAQVIWVPSALADIAAVAEYVARDSPEVASLFVRRLTTTIIKARSEEIKKGDGPSDPLELIVRGHSKDGEYFEERILRMPPSDKVTPKLIADALSPQGQPKAKKRPKGKQR